MVKPAGPGVYSATYSNIPVYEFQFGEGLKEHVMRRRGDDWINATHILKAAGFDKPARTRILEREVQKEMHEKVQGGYGKYQGTWVPLEQGEALAQRNNVYEKLRTIFEFIPGNLSPPPAPKHTTAKPKAPKKPAVPKWGNVAAVPRGMEDDYDNISAQLNDDESFADDVTVASASYLAEDDRYDMSQHGTGHRKRKREDAAQSAHDQAHVLYADELLDYFMISHDNENVLKPEPPLNFAPDWIIDTDGHTALHWGAAMGDMAVIKELIKHGASSGSQNIRGETPLMRSVMFTNCQDKQTMPGVVKELINTIEMVDFCQATALHHAAAITISRQKHHSSRYYLDVILNKMQEIMDPDQLQRVLDARDMDGNTACHIAAQNGARKSVRALIGRGARSDILNNDKHTAEDWIQRLNSNRQDRQDRRNGSSSPFAPDHSGPIYSMPEEIHRTTTHLSEAAMSIESKIIPLMHEKFQDLAASFDEEFTERETSEKAAKRILANTLEELNSINSQILNIEFYDDPDTEEHKKVHLAHLEEDVTSLIEQQQKLQLLTRAQHESTKSNGHMISEDDITERAVLAKTLCDEQDKRAKLVGGYRDALSLAGAGEKGEMYRRLISKCVGQDFNMMDEETLNSLLEQLRDDQHGREGETVHPDDL